MSFKFQNSSLQEQFWIAVFEIKISKRNIWHTLKTWLPPVFPQEFCRFYLVGTGTDWLSTCVISTSTESVLENWTSTSTSTSTSVPKTISGLKKSVPVPVDWLIYSNPFEQGLVSRAGPAELFHYDPIIFGESCLQYVVARCRKGSRLCPAFHDVL